MTSAAMRRSQRVRFETPLTITSLDPHDSFVERCKTLVVNAQGCGVVSSRAMAAGTLVKVDVPATQRGASGRILNCTPLGSRGDAYGVGVELDAPGNIWGLENPPADWQVTPYDTRAVVSAAATKPAPSAPAPAASPAPPAAKPQVSAPPPPAQPATSVTKEELRQQELRADAILREFEARYRKSAVDLLNEMRTRFHEEASADWVRMQQQAQQNLQDAVRLLQDDLEQKLSPLRQATSSADSHLESLRHLRDEVAGHVESAKLREQAGKMQMEILGQARGQIQELLAELSSQARQLQHLREDLNAHAASQLRQITQSRQDVEALAESVPQTIDRKIQQDSAIALRMVRERAEQELSERLRSEMDKLQASARLAAEQQVSGYGAQLNAQLSRQYEQVMADLRTKANEVVSRCQQEMMAGGALLNQQTETRLQKAGEELGASVKQRVQAEMDQYRRELERSREQIRAELEEVQQRRREIAAQAEEVRHARELVESLVLNLPATVDANVRARALDVLTKTREQITAETADAAHSAAERLKAELSRQAEASEAQLRSRLEQLLAQAEAQTSARLDHQAIQLTQRGESAVASAADASAAALRQQFEADFARRRQELEQAHRSAREELHKLQATADSLLAQVDVQLHGQADELLKETLAHVQEELQHASNSVRASTVTQAQAELEATVASLRSRAETSAGLLRDVLQSLERENQRTDTAGVAMRQQVEQARTWLEQETQRFQKMVSEASTLANREIQGHVERAMESSQQPIRQQAQEIRAQLEALSTSRSQEIGNKLEELRQRLQDLGKATEQATGENLKARLAEALQSFRQDADKLAENSLARWQAALADMLASMPNVLRTKLEKPE